MPLLYDPKTWCGKKLKLHFICTLLYLFALSSCSLPQRPDPLEWAQALPKESQPLKYAQNPINEIYKEEIEDSLSYDTTTFERINLDEPDTSLNLVEQIEAGQAVYPGSDSTHLSTEAFKVEQKSIHPDSSPPSLYLSANPSPNPSPPLSSHSSLNPSLPLSTNPSLNPSLHLSSHSSPHPSLHPAPQFSSHQSSQDSLYSSSHPSFLPASQQTSQQLSPQLKRGIFLYKSKKFEQALTALNLAASLNSYEAGIYFYRALTYLELGLPERASLEWNKYSSFKPTGKFSRIKTRLLLALGKVDSARYYGSLCTQEFPGDSLCLSLLGAIKKRSQSLIAAPLLDSHQVNSTQNSITQQSENDTTITSRPSTKTPDLKKLISMINEGKFKQAQNLLAQLESKNSQNSLSGLLRYFAFLIYSRTSQPGKAQAALLECRNLDAHPFYLWEQIKWLKSQNQITEALELITEMEVFLEKNKTLPSPHPDLKLHHTISPKEVKTTQAQLEYQGKLFNKARETWKSLTTHFKLDQRELLEAAEASLAVGEYTEALTYNTLASQVHPPNFKPAVQECKILFYSGKTQEALKKCTWALSKNPKAHEAHYWRGKTLEHLNVLSDALTDYQEACYLAPQMEIYQRAAESLKIKLIQLQKKANKSLAR